jgi:branched-chain amino acid transport system substrate-binding protein
MQRSNVIRRGAAAAVVAAVLAGCSSGAAPTPTTQPSALVAPPLRIGAVFPTSGTAAQLASQELAGVRIAAQFVNEDGGVGGRPIDLDVRDLESAADAPGVMQQLQSDGVTAVVGAYSSDLSIAASAAANDAGLVYWEAGAVADQVTGRGLPLVFRVGPSGSNLGTTSLDFAASQLAPRLGRTATSLRVAIVNADDAYAQSVADAAAGAAAAASVNVVLRESYNLTVPQWPLVMQKLAAAAPDVIILASHVPDGIAFRQAMLADGVYAGALIGSTMAECDPDFAGTLGAGAVGVFAADRPTGGFQPSALLPSGRALYDRLAAAWAAQAGAATAPTSAPQATPGDGYGYGGSSEYGGSGASEPTIVGPVMEGSAAAGPPEEVLAGFSAAWALFDDVLPAAAPGGFSTSAIASSARGLDLLAGSLPNGAGVRFSSAAATLGQNERAPAVVWQWQAIDSYTYVWPPAYTTGQIADVPLPR